MRRLSTEADSASGPRSARPRKRGWRRHPATRPATACWESCQKRSGVKPSSLAPSSRLLLPSHVFSTVTAVWWARVLSSGLAAFHSARTGAGIRVGT